MTEKQKILDIEQVREWLTHPVSQAIKDNYEERLDILRKVAIQGQHIDPKSGQIKVTYAMDVGHAMCLEMFLSIWQDPHSFKDSVNSQLEESKDEVE